MNDIEKNNNSATMKLEQDLLFKVMLSLIFAAVMLILSTVFADTAHSQSIIMPLIAMLFTPLFLLR